MKTFVQKNRLVMLFFVFSTVLIEAASHIIVGPSNRERLCRMKGAVVLPIKKESLNTYFSIPFIVKSLAEVYGLGSCHFKERDSVIVATYDLPKQTFKLHMEGIIQASKSMNALGLALYTYHCKSGDYVRVGVYHFPLQEQRRAKPWLCRSYFQITESADVKAAL